MIELAAQVCGETYVFDRDPGHQPTLAIGSKLIDNLKIIPRCNDLGVDSCLAVQARLTGVDEVGLLEKQQFLNIGALKELAKENEKLLLLLKREARPMLTERCPAHRVGVKKVPEEARQSSQLVVVRLIATNDSARLLQRGARVFERIGGPGRTGQADPNNH